MAVDSRIEEVLGALVLKHTDVDSAYTVFKYPMDRPPTHEDFPVVAHEVLAARGAINPSNIAELELVVGVHVWMFPDFMEDHDETLGSLRLEAVTQALDKFMRHYTTYPQLGYSGSPLGLNFVRNEIAMSIDVGWIPAKEAFEVYGFIMNLTIPIRIRGA